MVPLLELRKQVWTGEEIAQSQREAGVGLKPRSLSNLQLRLLSSPNDSVFDLPCEPEGRVYLLTCCNPWPRTSCALRFDSEQQRRS